MTEVTKRRSRGKKKSRLQGSGLAEDVLGTKESGSEGAETETDQASAKAEEPVPEPPTGPDRIFQFADSLDQEVGAHQDRVREELETWVTLELANEVFALPVTHVQEILRVTSITAVPHAPKPVRGVTNKRGRVLPVVDLRVRLGLAEADLTSKSRILVVESKSQLLGLLVDGVHQVVRLPPSDIQPAPPDVMTEQSDYILGVFNLEEALVILLDVHRVLIIPESI